MAEVNRIFFHNDRDREKRVMRVYATIRGIGEKQIDVALPVSLYEAVMAFAETAADHEQARIRGEIIGENHMAALSIPSVDDVKEVLLGDKTVQQEKVGQVAPTSASAGTAMPAMPASESSDAGNGSRPHQAA